MVIALVFLASCGGAEEPLPPMPPEQYKESLVKANRHLVSTEAEDIEAYISRYGLELKATGSGLRYQIYEYGTGVKAEAGKVARIQYTLSLLNGKECYTSKNLGPMEFLIGRGGVESGLEEAILLMREGDRGRFVLPSHLARGLLGDDDCIPAKATLIYDLKLLSPQTATQN